MHGETAKSLDNLGQVLRLQHQYGEAANCHLQSIDPFTRAGNECEARNVEINLQTMFHLADQPVDAERVEELTRILEEAGDPRAEKGRKLLVELGLAPGG